MSIYSPMNDDERAGVVAPTPEPRCRHCDVTPSCLACTGWTNDSGKKPVHAAGCREGMVERGAAALGTWINAKYPPAWVPGAARVVLNAALTGGSTPLADRQPEVSAHEDSRDA